MMLGSGLSGPHTICRRTLKIRIYHPSCMYRGCEWMKWGIDQMPPWWHCMMDINLLVLFTIEKLTNPDQIPTPYAGNQTQTCNHHPPCCLTTPTPSMNILPLWEPGISNLYSLVGGTNFFLFLQSSSYDFVNKCLDFPFWKWKWKTCLLCASLPQRAFLTRLLWAVSGHARISQVMLLWLFQLQRDVSLMCFSLSVSTCIFCFLALPISLCACYKHTGTPCGKTHFLSEMQDEYVLCCYVLTCYGVSIIRLYLDWGAVFLLAVLHSFT